MESYELSSSFKPVKNAEKVPFQLPLSKTNFNFQELLLPHPHIKPQELNEKAICLIKRRAFFPSFTITIAAT
jgi:hypothetical protein